jgi:hypothetical protein
MMLKKRIIAACALVTLAIAAGSGVVLVRAAAAQDSQPAPAAAPSQPAQPAVAAKPAPKPEEIDPLLQQLLDAARKRFEAQKAYYEAGRITLDRFLDACSQLGKVELLAAKTDAERAAIRRRDVDLFKEIEIREQAEKAVGRGTDADVAEAHLRRLGEEFAQKIAEKEAAEKAAILRRLDDLERKVEQLQKALSEKR